MKNKYTTFIDKIRIFYMYFYNPSAFKMLQLVFVLLVLGICADAIAGTDILENTDADLMATLNGSGKKYLYLTEGILALAGYIKTKNLLLLIGIVVVSFFFNLIITVYNAS